MVTMLLVVFAFDPHRVRFWLDIGGNLPLSIFQNSFHTACGGLAH